MPIRKESEPSGEIIYHDNFRKNLMKMKSKISALRCELEHYRKQGVLLLLNGEEHTPKEIAKACMIAEEGGYMRDYLQNEAGEVECLEFDFVQNEER